jgi:uncharacterized protein with PQ loop repeat
MNKKQLQQAITILAAIFTATAFVPKAWRVYKTRDVKELDHYTLFLFFIGQILWLIDAILTNDIGLLLASILNTGIYMYLIYAKYTY